MSIVLVVTAGNVPGERRQPLPRRKGGCEMEPIRRFRRDQGCTPDWRRLVEVTVRTYTLAHGPEGAVRRLRRHVPDWPTAARAELGRLAMLPKVNRR